MKTSEGNNLMKNEERESYVPLAKEIFRNGSIYKLVVRDNVKALYSQQYKGMPNVIAHELFYIRKKNRKLNPRTVERVLMEIYPSTSDFGSWAWSITSDTAKAIERFNALRKGGEDE